MPHWLLKSALHHAMAGSGKGQFWNALFQEHVTGSLTMNTDAAVMALGRCKRHLDALFARPDPPKDFTVLEVGTGWYPIQPIGMVLCGASKVWTYDLDPLLKRKRLRLMLEHLVRFAR